MTSHSTLTIRNAVRLSADTRLFELVRADGADFGFRGGQYLILNTGLTAPSGKLVKRAYSVLSTDETQSAVRIAVKKLSGTLGSNFLHHIAASSELGFSGPWGKWSIDPTWQESRLLMIVTDTAITAALGAAVSKSGAGKQIDVLWLRESEAYFLPEAFVNESLGDRAGLSIACIPKVGDPMRVAEACRVALEHAEQKAYDRVLCAGDGAVIYPLRALLSSRGVPEEHVLLESFFNNPQKKSA